MFLDSIGVFDSRLPGVRMWHYIRVCIVCLDITGTSAVSEDPEEMQQKRSALSAETKQSPGTVK